MICTTYPQARHWFATDRVTRSPDGHPYWPAQSLQAAGGFNTVQVGGLGLSGYTFQTLPAGAPSQAIPAPEPTVSLTLFQSDSTARPWPLRVQVASGAADAVANVHDYRWWLVDPGMARYSIGFGPSLADPAKEMVLYSPDNSQVTFSHPDAARSSIVQIDLTGQSLSAWNLGKWADVAPANVESNPQPEDRQDTRGTVFRSLLRGTYLYVQRVSDGAWQYRQIGAHLRCSDPQIG